MDWEFSYLDLKGNFRGPFSPHLMQKWHEKGYFCSDLKLFVHRGHIADITTLEELRKKNGERTPFIFSNPPKHLVIHRGFVEFPPGIKVKPKNSRPTTSSNANVDVLTESTPAVSQGDQKIAVIHPLPPKNSVTNVSLTVSEKVDSNAPAAVQKDELVISEKEVTSAVAKNARPWPLLSLHPKNNPRTMRKTWINTEFRNLAALLKNVDMKKLDDDPENRDLRGAICKLCYVELTAASDVMKHLTVKVHQERVLRRCQIVGAEFDDYKKRLQKAAKSSAEAISTSVVKATRSLSPAANSAASTKTSPENRSTSAASSTPASVKTTAPSKALNSTSKALSASASNVKTFYNSQMNPSSLTSLKAPDCSKESTYSKPGDVSCIKLFQTTSTSSRVLTDDEFEEKMEELRVLSHKINTSKFMAMYKDRMSRTFCHMCSVKTHGPTTLLAHHVSQKHCEKMKSSGSLPTEHDIALWKCQILAGK
ncbi:hypothetical protein Aduo_013446 [Ancylostoma duodenale]